ncbi:MAG: hypothetical protein ACI94Y_000697 [Maribacter sp.]|jgi:hypothetical protein
MLIYHLRTLTIRHIKGRHSNNETNKNEIIKEENSISNKPIQDSVSLITKINREQVARFNTSTALIGNKIREIIFSDEKGLTIEDLLDQQLIFRNNKGKIINVQIRSVVDTIYFEKKN